MAVAQLAIKLVLDLRNVGLNLCGTFAVPFCFDFFSFSPLYDYIGTALKKRNSASILTILVDRCKEILKRSSIANA